MDATNLGGKCRQDSRLLHHPTYHTQEENNTFFYFVPLFTITRARYCEGDTSTAKNLISWGFKQLNSIPALTFVYVLRLYTQRAPFSMVDPHATLKSKRQVPNLYSLSRHTVIGNNPIHSLKCFQYCPSHCMFLMWTYVPKEVLHNSHPSLANCKLHEHNITY